MVKYFWDDFRIAFVRFVSFGLTAHIRSSSDTIIVTIIIAVISVVVVIDFVVVHIIKLFRIHNNSITIFRGIYFYFGIIKTTCWRYKIIWGWSIGQPRSFHWYKWQYETSYHFLWFLRVFKFFWRWHHRVKVVLIVMYSEYSTPLYLLYKHRNDGQTYISTSSTSIVGLTLTYDARRRYDT